MQVDTIYNEECLEGMNRIDDHSIDMILCDLPYGTTACKWDIIIPFEPLWKQYKRVIKKGGAIVLFGSEPFSSLLRTATWVNDKGKTESALSMFKYDWVWDKHIPRNFINAKIMPMQKHEIISVFGVGKINYYPQMIIRDKPVKVKNYSKGNSVYTLNNDGSDHSVRVYTHINPNTIIVGKWEANKGKLHPTQKPVTLMEYLIKTYTQEYEIVLDNCIGSGTTAIAAINTNRHYVGYELDTLYYQVAIERIQKHGSTRV